MFPLLLFTRYASDQQANRVSNQCLIILVFYVIRILKMYNIIFTNYVLRKWKTSLKLKNIIFIIF